MLWPNSFVVLRSFNPLPADGPRDLRCHGYRGKLAAVTPRRRRGAQRPQSCGAVSSVKASLR